MKVEYISNHLVSENDDKFLVSKNDVADYGSEGTLAFNKALEIVKTLPFCEVYNEHNKTLFPIICAVQLFVDLRTGISSGCLRQSFIVIIKKTILECTRTMQRYKVQPIKLAILYSSVGKPEILQWITLKKH